MLVKVTFIEIHDTVDWSSVMIELSLPRRVTKTAGGGCLFHWDAFGIKMMV